MKEYKERIHSKTYKANTDLSFIQRWNRTM